ncbi:ABC transporter ATP-binding protein [Paenibacillus sp. 2TAF8]|jgi:ATP-binding cassette subfamily C protein|uniref:ABC transporter ATP-binding protein n=1 Tax=Paenibacillus sp. 2TAF8 TaxID=3233020 RepID=UPI003F9A794A
MMKKMFSNLMYLRPYLEGSRLLLILSFGALAMVSLIAMPIPLITGKIIDNLSSSQGTTYFLYQQVIIIICLHVIRYVLSLFGKYYIVKAGTRASNELRMKMIGHTVDMPMEFIDKHDKGYLMSRISESGSIGSLFSPSVINILIGVLDGVISVILLVRIHWKLSLIVLAIIPLYVVVTVWYSRRMSDSTRKVSESSAEMAGVMFETLNGIEEIKVQGAKQRYISRICTKTDQVITAILRQNRNINGYMESSSLLSSLSGAIVLLFSGIMILGKTLTLGEYVSFTGYLAKVLGNVQAVATFGVTINPIMVSIDRVREYMDNKDEEFGRRMVLSEPIHSVNIHNISYAYISENEKRSVLDQLNVNLFTGDIVILNGANGSGKTTFVKLLLGLYPVNKGTILYNGMDISCLKLSDLRRRVSYISQKTYLFQGTILDNILPNAQPQQLVHLRALLVKYQLQPFISDFPNELHTEIAHGGANLSGGQRQMIAFLRTVLANKEMVILDEPTANMDAVMKSRVIQMIENESFYTILVVISHDPDLFYLGKPLNLGESSREMVGNSFT